MLRFGITAHNSKRRLKRCRRQSFLRFLLACLSKSSTLELNLSLKAAEFAPQAQEMGLNCCRLDKPSPTRVIQHTRPQIELMG